MKPQQNPKHKDPLREERNPGKSHRKEKNQKPWVKEYQWKSEKDFNTYPKSWGQRDQYTEEWQQETWGKFKTPEGVLDSLKHDARSAWMYRFLQGRNWRARNIVTEETVEFPDIENYYK